MRNWFRNTGVAILFLLLGIFISVWLAYTIFLLRRDPQLASAYIAVGTLLLAAATIFLAFFSWLSIKSGYDREKRDRRERRLKEIVDWATDILVCGRDISRELYRELIDPTSHKAVEIEIEAKFNVISWRGVYIRNIASNLDKALHDSVLDTQRILRQHVKIMELDFKGKIKNTSVIGKHRDTLDDSAKRVIEIAANLLSDKTSAP